MEYERIREIIDNRSKLIDNEGCWIDKDALKQKFICPNINCYKCFAEFGILSLDGIEIRADDQTIAIPCYQDGDMEKAEYIKAEPPSWIADAGFIRVIPKPKRK